MMIFNKIAFTTLFIIIFSSCAPVVYYRSQKVSTRTSQWYENNMFLNRLTGGLYGTACVITNDHKVKCWGDGTNGMLGNGSNSTSLTPVEVQIDPSRGIPVSLASGDRHTCVLYANKTVQCWGNGNNGGPCYLGDGLCTHSNIPVTPVGLSGVIEISSGEHDTCALTDSGSIYCWGGNMDGQAGDGTLVKKDTPFLVPGISNAIHVSSTGRSTCATLSDSSVLCWGRNAYGQLGLGSTSAAEMSPIVSTVLLNSKSIVSGYYNLCFTDLNDAVSCMGYDYFISPIGTGGNVLSPFSMGLNAKQLSSNWGHVCSLSDSGVVSCWGRNAYGHLGRGTTSSYSATPMAVSGLPSDIIEVKTLDEGTLALAANGDVYCWGSNHFGACGTAGALIGTVITTPVKIDGL